MVKTKQKSNSTFAVLDAGTSKIAAIITETNKNGDLIVIGDAIQESSGLRGGEINNLEAFSTAIGNTIQMAEEKAGMTVQEVHLVCNAGQPNIQVARSNIDFERSVVTPLWKFLMLELERMASNSMNMYNLSENSCGVLR